MKRTFTATAPNGQTFKRTSESKVYAFTVVTPRSYERALELARTIEKTDLVNFAWYRGLVANGGVPAGGKRYDWETDESLAARAAKAAAEIGDCQDAQAYAERKAAERVATVEKRQAEGHYAKFDNAGWCSRRDLAEKLAGHLRDALILEVL